MNWILKVIFVYFVEYISKEFKFDVYNNARRYWIIITLQIDYLTELIINYSFSISHICTSKLSSFIFKPSSITKTLPSMSEEGTVQNHFKSHD